MDVSTSISPVAIGARRVPEARLALVLLVLVLGLLGLLGLISARCGPPL
ncbi:MAG TPA: hypothetical protein VKZ63_17375 [Kofleriaceae bacterium]|nr:hypothetical protein [Kofleriaceae bacterium]